MYTHSPAHAVPHEVKTALGPLSSKPLSFSAYSTCIPRSPTATTTTTAATTLRHLKAYFLKIKSQSRLLKGRRATPPSAKHTAFAVAGQGGAASRLPQRRMPSFSDPTSKAHTHIHTHTQTRSKKRKQKMKTRAWLHFRNVMRKRRPEISAARSCQKKKQTNEDRKRKHKNAPPPAARSCPTQDGQGSRGTACRPTSCPSANPGGSPRAPI